MPRPHQDPLSEQSIRNGGRGATVIDHDFDPYGKITHVENLNHRLVETGDNRTSIADSSGIDLSAIPDYLEALPTSFESDFSEINASLRAQAGSRQISLRSASGSRTGTPDSPLTHVGGRTDLSSPPVNELSFAAEIHATSSHATYSVVGSSADDDASIYWVGSVSDSAGGHEQAETIVGFRDDELEDDGNLGQGPSVILRPQATHVSVDGHRLNERQQMSAGSGDDFKASGSSQRNGGESKYGSGRIDAKKLFEDDDGIWDTTLQHKTVPTSVSIVTSTPVSVSSADYGNRTGDFSVLNLDVDDKPSMFEHASQVEPPVRGSSDLATATETKAPLTLDDMEYSGTGDFITASLPTEEKSTLYTTADETSTPNLTTPVTPSYLQPFATTSTPMSLSEIEFSTASDFNTDSVVLTEVKPNLFDISADMSILSPAPLSRTTLSTPKIMDKSAMEPRKYASYLQTVTTSLDGAGEEADESAEKEGFRQTKMNLDYGTAFSKYSELASPDSNESFSVIPEDTPSIKLSDPLVNGLSLEGGQRESGITTEIENPPIDEVLNEGRTSFGDYDPKSLKNNIPKADMELFTPPTLLDGGAVVESKSTGASNEVSNVRHVYPEMQGFDVGNDLMDGENEFGENSENEVFQPSEAVMHMPSQPGVH